MKQSPAVYPANVLGDTQNRQQIATILQSMGFETDDIKKAFNVFEKSYGDQKYDISILTEIVFQIQQNENKHIEYKDNKIENTIKSYSAPNSPHIKLSSQLQPQPQPPPQPPTHSHIPKQNEQILHYQHINTINTQPPPPVQNYNHINNNNNNNNNNNGRRYSDNYAIKPIITSSLTHQPNMNGYIINPPINNINTPLRLQRSKSQRLQGRRSVHLNDRKKSARDFYEEWKQKHANDNLFLNSMSYNNNNYPYPMNTNTSITPTHSIPHSPLIQTQRQPHTHAQQYQLNNNTQYYVVRNPAQHTHARIHPHVQQPQYVTYNMEYYDNFDINDINN
eukprot:1007811_1